MLTGIAAAILVAQTYSPGSVLHPGGIPPQPRAGAPVAPMGGYGQPPQQYPARQQSATGGPRGHRGTVVAVPVPVYIGGGSYEEPSPPPAAPPHEAPVVLINPNYQPEQLNPVLRDYSNVPLQESPPLEQRLSEPPQAVIQQADPSPTIYLIALNDGTIAAALGFWMEGDTLHYITRDGNRNRVSIDRVDREFSTRLNTERHLDFKLP